MRPYIQQFLHMDSDLLSETDEEFRFIQLAIRFDVYEVLRFGKVAEHLNRISAMKFVICRSVAIIFNRHFVEIDTEFAEEIGLKWSLFGNK
ncbi:MAG: hypothetical protein EZS28_027084 [Streblomastix strix]|uniref:Uncharacterized protein n=1 Tax=Streblomastix strix TaxID=222440 RepID=A0A5J4V3R7_9EUKA|nr:MAG: hypothetical protein EZS28_027084 [Streblomastix strix]